MDTDNINKAFATPKSDVAGATAATGGTAAMTTGIVDQLKRTRPWVLFLSIVGFISTAFMALGTFGLIAAVVAAPAELANQKGVLMGMAVVYLLFTLVYFFASLYLIKYSGAIKRLVSTGTTQDLEHALKSQASFWKLIGIIVLVSILAMIVFMIAGIAGLFNVQEMMTNMPR